MVALLKRFKNYVLISFQETEVLINPTTMK